MSIHVDPEGRRTVQVEAIVPGTPETVWEAIATGPGISSWFMDMDTEFDEKVGGKIRTRQGDKMVEVGTLTAWDPPRRFASEGPDGFGPGSPKMAVEWSVEARTGDTCVVRVVQSLFASDDAWDTQLGDLERGWAAFLDVLHAYLARHRGQPCGIVQAMAPASGTVAEAYGRLTAELGIAGAGTGQAVASEAEGAPAFAGTVEKLVTGKALRAMVRLEKPFPGTAWIGAETISGQVTDIVCLYYYGDGAKEAAARDLPVMGAWLQGHATAVAT